VHHLDDGSSASEDSVDARRFVQVPVLMVSFLQQLAQPQWGLAAVPPHLAPPVMPPPPPSEVVLQDLFNTQIDVASTKLQAVCNETLKKAQDDFQSSMRMCLKQILATNARVDQHSHTIADIQRRQNDQEREQDRIRDTVARMERTIALVEAQASAFDTAKLAQWERQAEPTLFTIGAPSAIAPLEVRRAVQAWVTESGLTMDQIELDGQ
ncbi:unnamed protein product, partial [Prorocentrum cordatum]